LSTIGKESTYQLEAKLPDWCALKWHHAVICASFVTVYLYLSYLPIPVIGTWDHVWSGAWIVSHGFSNTDPSLPLSDGMRSLNATWLSDVLIYGVHDLGGPLLLSIVFAIVQTTTLAIWAWVFVRFSKDWRAALLPLVAAIVSIPFVGGLQPSAFAMLCFAGILWLIPVQANSRPRILWHQADLKRWAAMGILFVIWTNLDTSFVVGLAFLGCLAFGRLIDLATQRVSLSSDRELGRRFILLEIMTLLTLINPNVWRLHESLLWWPDNPILHSFGGYSPVLFASWTGAGVALIWIVWFFAGRTTRVSAWAFLVPVLATVMVACCEPFVIWFAPLTLLAAASLLPSTQMGTSRESDPDANLRSDQTDQPQSLRFAFLLICGLFVWIGFSLSPISNPILGGNGLKESQILAKKSPVGLSKFLKSNRPQGLVWAPLYWGGWLQTKERPTEVFANSNYHRLPELSQRDYQRVFRGDKSWKKTMERYAITDLVIDKSRQPELQRSIRLDGGNWVKVFDDEMASVYRLKVEKSTQNTARRTSAKGIR
jgi:hypothetical protein